MRFLFLIIVSLVISCSTIVQRNEKTILNQVITAKNIKEFCGDDGFNDLERSREMSQIITIPKVGNIVQLSCDFFAYQGLLAYIYYEIEPQGNLKLTQMKIEQYDPESKKIKEEKTILGVAFSDNSQDNYIAHFTKYRGIGDIGMFYRHQINIQQNKLILIEQRERDESETNPIEDSQRSLPPEQWPLIYPR